MALTNIQTTTGTAEPDQLGRTLIHEHVLIGYPGWSRSIFRKSNKA